MLKITWLEELVSESNTIQAQEDITSPGKTAGSDPRKLCVRIRRFFIDISGWTSSFGLALFVVLDNVVLLQPVATESSGKSMGERLGGSKVREHMMKKCRTCNLGTVGKPKWMYPGPGVRADAQC